MFAKTGTKPQSLAELMTISARPVAIRAADDELARATATRETVQARHIELKRQYEGQRAGDVQSITMAEVDEAGAAIAPALEAERRAAEKRQAERAKYEMDVNGALADPLQQYEEAIHEKLNELEALLAIGAALNAAAVANKVKLSSNIPRVSSQLITNGTNTVRKMLRMATR